MSPEILLPTATLVAAYGQDVGRNMRFMSQKSGLDMDAREALEEGKADLRESKGLQKYARAAAIGLFATAVAFEWGPGNEALLSYVAGQNLKDTAGLLAPLTIGLKTGLVSFGEQLVCGAAGIAAVRSVPRFMQKVRDIKEIHHPAQEEAEIQETKLWARVKNRAKIAIVTGANFFLIKEHSERSDRTFPEDALSVAASAAAVGTFIVGLAGVYGLSSYAGPEVSDFVGTWTAPAVVGSIAVGAGIKARSEFKKARSLPEAVEL
mgnify:CR=1 FL=1